jgi:hypothetical protein
MNLRRSLFLFAAVLLLGAGLSTWRYLTRLQSAVPSASMSAPPGSLDERIAQAVSALPGGTISIDGPRSALRVGDETTVRAVVRDRIRTAVADALAHERATGALGSTTARIAVSQLMNAKLYGGPDHVRITPLQSADEFLAFGPDRAIEWSWRVKPLVAGDTELHLVVSAQNDAPTRPRIHLLAKDQPVHVATDLAATARDSIAQNWGWLWAAIVVPGADAAWAWYRRRRENPVGNPAGA